MPQVIDWRSVADVRDVTQLALRILQDGKIVGFPTETVYGLAASPAIPEAVARLCRSKGRPEDKPLTVAVPSAHAALEWANLLKEHGRDDEAEPILRRAYDLGVDAETQAARNS